MKLEIQISSTDPYFETREQTLVGMSQTDINAQLFDLQDYLQEMLYPYEVKIETIKKD